MNHINEFIAAALVFLPHLKKSYVKEWTPAPMKSRFGYSIFSKPS